MVVTRYAGVQVVADKRVWTAVMGEDVCSGGV
jgi:hypothetical protein